MITPLPGGAATCSEGFVVHFLKVPNACWGSSVAAEHANSLRELSENILKNLSEQVAAPPGIAVTIPFFSGIGIRSGIAKRLEMGLQSWIQDRNCKASILNSKNKS